MLIPIQSKGSGVYVLSQHLFGRWPHESVGLAVVVVVVVGGGGVT